MKKQIRKDFGKYVGEPVFIEGHNNYYFRGVLYDVHLVGGKVFGHAAVYMIFGCPNTNGDGHFKRAIPFTDIVEVLNTLSLDNTKGFPLFHNENSVDYRSVLRMNTRNAPLFSRMDVFTINDLFDEVFELPEIRLTDKLGELGVKYSVSDVHTN